MNTYNCLHCNKECKKGYSKKNKFCSNACQGKYKWVCETVPRIERGECSEDPTLAKYLIEQHGKRCKGCGTGDMWNGMPLTLQVDHIDGNSDNNQVINLRLLCPNCHTQTETYGSKGLGNRYRKSTRRNTYKRDYHKARMV